MKLSGERVNANARALSSLHADPVGLSWVPGEWFVFFLIFKFLNFYLFMEYKRRKDKWKRCEHILSINLFLIWGCKFPTVGQ